MVWGNPPSLPADKPPPRGSTLANSITASEQQFPSLGSAPIERGSATEHNEPAAVAAAKKVSHPPGGNQGGSNQLGYRVTGSKKGGFPVTVEKRSCGKKVTVIRNVSGDRSALLSGLKKKLGCGGVINQHGDVEVQGERQPAVEKFLTEMDCLKSVSRAKQASAAPTTKATAKQAAEPTKIDRKMAAARAPANNKNGVAATELSSITEQAAKKMKPAEMKAHLKAAGLSIQGNKKELLARLLEHIKQ
mmetsp:Transcript_34528/g.83547  ORF Transcript_34528/g.83547 Transcript_34528/m.83547 type:complete len:247 (+) Transcript_34528:61-801(+)